MKLNSARICNYRVHRDTEIEFDPKLTLITGPNESGKSTLVEAIHRALFLRARTGGRLLEAMRSVGGGDPEVTVALAVARGDVRVHKAFRGNARGECTLTGAGQPATVGDEAEERLAALLKVDGPLDGPGAEGRLPLRWAHLWVWQGRGGESPAESAVEQKDALARRLQRQGGAAVTQSDLDARVARAIRERYEALFTDAGKPRAGSEWKKAEEALDPLRRAVADRSRVLAELENAMERYTVARREIAEKTEVRGRNTAERSATTARLRAAEELERQLTPLDQALSANAKEIEKLAEIARRLAAERRKRDAAQAVLEPHERELATHRAEQAAELAALKARDSAREAARTRVTTAARRRNALTAHLRALELERAQTGLQHDKERIDACLGELHRLATRATQWPQLEARDLQTLRRLAQELAVAEAALSALGARIRVEAGSGPVTVGERELTAGAEALVTEDTAVAVGSVARLRILPGGNIGIAEARKARDTARGALTDKLGQLGVVSEEKALKAFGQLDELQQARKRLQAEWNAMGGDTIESRIQAVRTDREDAVRRAQVAAAEGDWALPPDPAATQAALRVSDGEYKAAEQDDQAAEAAFNEAQRKCAHADAAVQAGAGAVEAARRQWADATARIGQIEEQAGRDAERGEQLVQRTAERDCVTAARAALAQRLADLQPEQLRSDVARLDRADEQIQAALTRALQDQAAARERLRLNGATDPHAELEEARARLAQAENRAAELQAQALAVKRLADLAREVQQEVARQLAQPLADAAQGYLQCVFGAGSTVELDWNSADASFAGIRVNRERADLGTFAFESLSGGAREQVGIALRLALAEILAADYDGGLPIVLDDAFANSDPDRVKTLQRMLYRAAERGLQVIVLTCNPADYATLGGREVRLERAKIGG